MLWDRLRPPLRRDHWQRQIERMDPQTQWADIYELTIGREFPWDAQRASEMALIHTYAVPEIGELLARTGEFTERTEKRFDDTAIILVEAGNYIVGETKDPTAIRRLNRMHGAYDIPQDQMLYVLTTFVVTPKRWIERYGYRRLTQTEVESMVRYWQHMGELMGIRDIPVDYDGFAHYYDTYEAERFGFSDGGRAVSDATFDLVDSWYPSPLRPLVRWVGLAMLQPHVRAALRYDDPPGIVAAATEAAMRLRRHVLALLPARRDSVSPLDKIRLRTYPHGYDVARVGTFPTSSGGASPT